jgi:hypothetical protein
LRYAPVEACRDGNAMRVGQAAVAILGVTQQCRALTRSPA